MTYRNADNPYLAKVSEARARLEAQRASQAAHDAALADLLRDISAAVAPLYLTVKDPRTGLDECEIYLRAPGVKRYIHVMRTWRALSDLPNYVSTPEFITKVDDLTAEMHKRRALVPAPPVHPLEVAAPALGGSTAAAIVATIMGHSFLLSLLISTIVAVIVTGLFFAAFTLLAHLRKRREGAPPMKLPPPGVL